MKNLRQFEVVNEIARCGSISKAAEKLKVKQPTLSRFLLNCEKDLGFELFDRTTIPLTLTIAGEKFIKAAEKIIDAYHQLEKEIDEVKNDKKREIKIGISPSRSPYMLPIVLQEFLHENPNCKVIVKEKNTGELISELLSGNLDLIISLLSDGTRKFVREDLFTETILLACPMQFKNMDIMDILKMCSIINIGNGQRMWKLSNLIINELGIEDAHIECQSIESAMSLVNESLGVMFVPSYLGNGNKFENVIFKEISDELKNIIGSEIKRNVCIFYRKKQFLTSIEKSFIDTCKNIYLK